MVKKKMETSGGETGSSLAVDNSNSCSSAAQGASLFTSNLSDSSSSYRDEIQKSGKRGSLTRSKSHSSASHRSCSSRRSKGNEGLGLAAECASGSSMELMSGFHEACSEGEIINDSRFNDISCISYAHDRTIDEKEDISRIDMSKESANEEQHNSASGVKQTRHEHPATGSSKTGAN